jgi:hypothetical protein
MERGGLGCLRRRRRTAGEGFFVAFLTASSRQKRAQMLASGESPGAVSVRCASRSHRDGARRVVANGPLAAPARDRCSLRFWWECAPLAAEGGAVALRPKALRAHALLRNGMRCAVKRNRRDAPIALFVFAGRRLRAVAAFLIRRRAFRTADGTECCLF